MKKRVWLSALAVVLILALAAGTALADAFTFGGKSVTLFEGDTWQSVLDREGAPAEGEVTFSVSSGKVATVDDGGLVTALAKGKTTLTARVKTARKSWKAQMTVVVARRVTKVTLDTRNLTVYENDDPAVFDLLDEATEAPVLLLSVGKSVSLNATCTPQDASDKTVTYQSSDEGIATVKGRVLKGVQAGECDLLIASSQNPEITQTYHVLVIQPVKKLSLQTGSQTVNVGETLQLGAEAQPDNATVQGVTWSSRQPDIATVDENGLVTGVKKGTVTISAKAQDGSGATASVKLTVAQKAESLTLKETAIEVLTRRYVTLVAQVLPKNTDNKNCDWFSSDESVAKVQNGKVTGVGPGTCEITCVSRSNPDLSATATVEVIQRVEKLFFTTPGPVSLPVTTTVQLAWNHSPENVTNDDVTFTSGNKNIALVDDNGIVTGVKRGSTTITAQAMDGSGKKATIRVNVTQPVEGVSIQYPTYHVQIYRYMGVKALIQPSDANDYRVTWSTGDASVATVKNGSKNVGTVYGAGKGETTITGTTADGGFSASAEIRVADFNGAVMIEEMRMLNSGRLKIVLRNMADFVIEKVNFIVECYDQEGGPMVGNRDGVSGYFTGYYQATMNPYERSDASFFNLDNMWLSGSPGHLVLRITSWEDAEGYVRKISDVDDQPTADWFNPDYGKSQAEDTGFISETGDEGTLIPDT